MRKSPVQAFDKLYDDFAEMVFRYFSMRLSDRERALDLMQETFVRVWNAYYRQGKEVAYEKALVFRVAHNLLVNAYERDKKDISLDAMAEAGAEIGDHAHVRMLDEVEHARAVDMFSQLAPPYREILFLRYVEDLSIKEIAEITEENENAVSVRIHRGLKQLKELYGA